MYPGKCCANCGFAIEAHGSNDDECPIYNGCFWVGWMTSSFREVPDEESTTEEIKPEQKLSRECLCGIARVDCEYHK